MKNCDRRDSAHRTRPVAKSRQAVDVPKWRNWQTRYIQGVVPVREWRFESSLRHQKSGRGKPKTLPTYNLPSENDHAAEEAAHLLQVLIGQIGQDRELNNYRLASVSLSEWL